MASELTPGGSKPRMTNAQIRKLQREQEEARRIAEEKLAAAKKSDEWKKEEKILNSIENALEDDKLIPTTQKVKEENKKDNTKLSFWQKIILWLKELFK